MQILADAQAMAQARWDHAQQQLLQNTYTLQQQILRRLPGSLYDTADLPEEKQEGEIVAWRAWDFKDGYLRSPYRSSTEWHPGEIAIADADPFDSDGGFYAHKTTEWLFVQEGPPEEPNYDVAGTVLLWGHVVEHEHGYRAQYARIGKLLHFKPDMSESFIRWLKAEFDMPE